MAEQPAQEAAAGVLEDVFGEVATEADPIFPTDANEAPEGEQQQEEEEAVALPEISWEVPAELQELLEAPDFDEEEEDDEPVAEVQTEDYEYEDPEKARLARQLAKAQKQLQYEKTLKVKASRKNWEAEAQKYFQFSNPSSIEANSRRAFLKEAQRQHAAVAKVVKPVYDQLAAERARLKEEAKAEARAEAEAAWGRPTTGPQAATNYLENTQIVERKRLDSARGLTSVIKARLASGETKL
jgi:hypothetical protein